MNDPWPRIRGFAFCTMIFVVFGTLMSWADPLNGNIKGIDEPIGKLVFLLAVVSIALILLVQELDFKWIARISVIICVCLLYYILTITIRYDISTSTIGERIMLLREGIYFTLVSTILTIFVAMVAMNAHTD